MNQPAADRLWPPLRLVAFGLVALLAVFSVYRVEQEAHRRTNAIATESRAREDALRAETADRLYQACMGREATRQVLRDVISYVIASAAPGAASAEHLRQYIDGPAAPLAPASCQKGSI